MSLQIQAQAEKERRRRKKDRVDVASQFKKRYRHRPDLFVLECITWAKGQGPSDYQIQILKMLPKYGRVAIRGPHGLGKTAMAAWLVLWFALTRDGEDWKIPTLASAWRQLTKYLWPEIRKWARRLKWEKIGRAPFNTRLELQKENLNLETGEAFALASDDHETIEGAHADEMLYVFDESKAIPAATWDAAEGAASTGLVLFFSISTPGAPNGRFYEIHSRKPGYLDWATRHVTLLEAIKAGRVSKKWAEARKAQWGIESAVYQNRVLGEFAASDEDAVIPLAWVEAAIERWHEWQEADYESTYLGIAVDVGRGGDPTVIGDKWEVKIDEDNVGIGIKELKKSNDRDLMPVVGKIKGKIDAHGGWAIIDVIGIGAGVYDRCNEMDLDVFAFNSSSKSTKKDESGEWGFTNRRSAAWWNAREMLQGDWVALPPDDNMIGDLTAPSYREMSGAKIQVESKKDIKKRLGRSTDDGDTVVMALDHSGGVLLF